jgi:hypothetical protein
MMICLLNIWANYSDLTGIMVGKGKSWLPYFRTVKYGNLPRNIVIFHSYLKLPCGFSLPGSMQQLYAEYSEIFISVKENTRRVPWDMLFLYHDQASLRFLRICSKNYLRCMHI